MGITRLSGAGFARDAIHEFRKRLIVDIRRFRMSRETARVNRLPEGAERGPAFSTDLFLKRMKVAKGSCMSRALRVFTANVVLEEIDDIAAAPRAERHCDQRRAAADFFHDRGPV